MKWTSRLKRSRRATQTEALCCLAAFIAAFSCGRRSSASLPLPVSVSVYSAFGCGKRSNSYALAFEAEAGLLLLLGTDAIIGDDVGHFGFLFGRVDDRQYVQTRAGIHALIVHASSMTRNGNRVPIAGLAGHNHSDHAP